MLWKGSAFPIHGGRIEGGTSGIAWQRSAHLRVERRLSPSVAGAKEDDGRAAWRLSSSPLKKTCVVVDVLVVSDSGFQLW